MKLMSLFIFLVLKNSLTAVYIYRVIILVFYQIVKLKNVEFSFRKLLLEELFLFEDKNGERNRAEKKENHQNKNNLKGCF